MGVKSRHVVIPYFSPYSDMAAEANWRAMDRGLNQVIPAGYDFISRTTLQATTASVTIMIPPNDYQGMVLKVSCSGTTAGVSNIRTQANGNATGVYYANFHFAANAGAWTAAADTAATACQMGLISDRTDLQATSEIQISNVNSGTFSPTYTFQSYSFDSAGTNRYEETGGGLMLVTGPLTSLKLTPSAGSFLSGSTFCTYGTF